LTASAFALLFSCALLVSIAVRLWLATRQVRHVALHRDAVPDASRCRLIAGPPTTRWRAFAWASSMR
jgi:hypothetical protein